MSAGGVAALPFFCFLETMYLLLSFFSVFPLGLSFRFVLLFEKRVATILVGLSTFAIFCFLFASGYR